MSPSDCGFLLAALVLVVSACARPPENLNRPCTSRSECGDPATCVLRYGDESSHCNAGLKTCAVPCDDDSDCPYWEYGNGVSKSNYGCAEDGFCDDFSCQK